MMGVVVFSFLVNPALHDTQHREENNEAEDKGDRVAHEGLLHHGLKEVDGTLGVPTALVSHEGLEARKHEEGGADRNPHPGKDNETEGRQDKEPGEGRGEVDFLGGEAAEGGISAVAEPAPSHGDEP
jgi:hypothetical protein